MALSSSTILRIRYGGSDTNGGGYSSGGTDWSDQDAPQYSVTDAVTAGTTAITSATANFGTDVVGNLAYVQGGTGAVAANWYQITARVSATEITVDRSTGLTAGTGTTLKIGGAFATPGVLSSVSGGIGGQLVSGMRAYMKYNASNYQITTTTAGPAGPCQIPASVIFFVEGYDVTPGDRTGNRPCYQWATAPGSATYAFVLNGGARQALLNLRADGGSNNNACGFSLASSRISIMDCVATNCNGTNGVGINGSSNSGSAIRCKSDTCVTGFNGLTSVIFCEAVTCTTGFQSFLSISRCIARACTTGYLSNSSQVIIERCIADSCTTGGFSTTTMFHIVGCIASNCTGSATGFVCGTNLAILFDCAAYNNNANTSGTILLNQGFITLSADPYVNQAGGDFRPNNTAGGGADLRNAGVGVYGQTDNADVGAVQHTDPASSGLTIPVSGGIVA